ncbi:alpha/beta hydrolase [Kaistia dalseonensis]|uniref:Acetyl esterase/lipase n=1 Tax=Kaistia dalseonensis TaxID=410840 RepID=A0ABU0H7L5_9HYPH|nr:alpha/beta hydrolase [Kaistia dalseonensis]MCX5495690.1 alpha/beta hydrolase [Kaistia dalseonensis]MDQ0438286.1 acetyl esterase/lipase [Kaistia dalseonensis]
MIPALPLAIFGLLGLGAFVGGAYVFRDSLLRAVTPDGGASLSRAIAYGDGPRRTLDVYVPRNAEGAPVVVFFYGGSWQMGRKELYGFVGNALAARGIVAVLPDYRVYPDVGFPEFLRDGAGATRWAKDNIARFGGDPSRIVLMGHSAGAYIAAMLALDGTWLRAEGLDPAEDIAALVGLSGPYDFLPLTGPTYIEIFGGAERPETQPVHFANAGAAPALLATGDEDTIVSPRNTASLARRLRGHGRPATEVVYAGRGHFGLILPFIGPLRSLAPVVDDVAVFIHAQPMQGGQR